MAVTRTVTKTFTRIDLMIMQVRIALKQTLDISEEQFDRVFRQGLQLHLIGKVCIYGVDGTGLCWAQILLEIDWLRHQVHVSAGRDSIGIDRRWRDETCPALQEIVPMFNDYVEEQNLSTLWQIYYAPGIDEAYARNLLGLVTAQAPTWAGEPESSSWDTVGLDELKVGCRFVFQ